MKKQLIVIGIIAVIICVGFSGCTGSLERQIYDKCLGEIPSYCDFESYDDSSIYMAEGDDFYRVSIKYGIKENVYGRETWSDYDILIAKAKVIGSNIEIKVYETDYTGEYTLQEFMSSWDA